GEDFGVSEKAGVVSGERADDSIGQRWIQAGPGEAADQLVGALDSSGAGHGVEPGFQKGDVRGTEPDSRGPEHQFGKKDSLARRDPHSSLFGAREADLESREVDLESEGGRTRASAPPRLRILA